MADAARIVQDMGADIVDINMGCPVPKIAKHNAGCSLMREPDHAARVVEAMVGAVTIPVTVKMRAGWTDKDRNAPVLARKVQDAGASADHDSRSDRRAVVQRPRRLGAGHRSRVICGFRFSEAAIASNPSRSSSA